MKADVGVFDCLQIELVERTWCPDIGAVRVDDLRYDVVDVDIEYVPLRRSTCQHFIVLGGSRRLWCSVPWQSHFLHTLQLLWASHSWRL